MAYIYFMSKNKEHEQQYFNVEGNLKAYTVKVWYIKVARLIYEPEVPGSYPVRPHTFVSLSADSRKAVVSYWRKYVHKVLVNRLGGLSLPMKSVVRLTDRPDMTTDVYRGRKTTTQNKTHQRRN